MCTTRCAKALPAARSNCGARRRRRRRRSNTSARRSPSAWPQRARSSRGCAKSSHCSRRARLAQQALERQRALATQGLVSAAQVEAAQSAAAAEGASESAAARALEALQAEITSLAQLLEQVAARQRASAASAARALVELAQQQEEFSVRGAFALRAPRDGIVTAIQAHVGQTAHPAHPLATLLPADGELIAHLLAPSRAVGFIEPGRPVLLRYQAFPYQKFGQYEGRVESVSKTALSPQELANLGVAAAPDPLYRVAVRLDAQHVFA